MHRHSMKNPDFHSKSSLSEIYLTAAWTRRSQVWLKMLILWLKNCFSKVLHEFPDLPTELCPETLDGGVGSLATCIDSSHEY